MAGDSFDTFSTRQDLSTIPICGVSTTESFESPVSDFFRKILSYRQDQNQPTIFHHVSFFTASHMVRIEECAAASCSSWGILSYTALIRATSAWFILEPFWAERFYASNNLTFSYIPSSEGISSLSSSELK